MNSSSCSTTPPPHRRQAGPSTVVGSGPGHLHGGGMFDSTAASPASFESDQSYDNSTNKYYNTDSAFTSLVLPSHVNHLTESPEDFSPSPVCSGISTPTTPFDGGGEITPTSSSLDAVESTSMAKMCAFDKAPTTSMEEDSLNHQNHQVNDELSEQKPTSSLSSSNGKMYDNETRDDEEAPDGNGGDELDGATGKRENSGENQSPEAIPSSSTPPVTDNVDTAVTSTVDTNQNTKEDDSMATVSQPETTTAPSDISQKSQNPQPKPSIDLRLTNNSDSDHHPDSHDQVLPTSPDASSRHQSPTKEEEKEHQPETVFDAELDFKIDGTDAETMDEQEDFSKSPKLLRKNTVTTSLPQNNEDDVASVEEPQSAAGETIVTQEIESEIVAEPTIQISITPSSMPEFSGETTALSTETTCPLDENAPGKSSILVTMSPKQGAVAGDDAAVTNESTTTAIEEMKMEVDSHSHDASTPSTSQLPPEMEVVKDEDEDHLTMGECLSLLEDTLKPLEPIDTNVVLSPEQTPLVTPSETSSTTSSTNAARKRHNRGAPALNCEHMDAVKGQCKQRAILSYHYCIRHILNDPLAPYKQCQHVRKAKSKREKAMDTVDPDGGIRCTNAIPADSPDVYCTTHLIMKGLRAPKKKRKTAAAASTADDASTLSSGCDLYTEHSSMAVDDASLASFGDAAGEFVQPYTIHPNRSESTSRSGEYMDGYSAPGSNMVDQAMQMHQVVPGGLQNPPSAFNPGLPPPPAFQLVQKLDGEYILIDETGFPIPRETYSLSQDSTGNVEVLFYQRPHRPQPHPQYAQFPTDASLSRCPSASVTSSMSPGFMSGRASASSAGNIGGGERPGSTAALMNGNRYAGYGGGSGGGGSTQMSTSSSLAPSPALSAGLPKNNGHLVAAGASNGFFQVPSRPNTPRRAAANHNHLPPPQSRGNFVFHNGQVQQGYIDPAILNVNDQQHVTYPPPHQMPQHQHQQPQPQLQQLHQLPLQQQQQMVQHPVHFVEPSPSPASSQVSANASASASRSSTAPIPPQQHPAPLHLQQQQQQQQPASESTVVIFPDGSQQVYPPGTKIIVCEDGPMAVIPPPAGADPRQGPTVRPVLMGPNHAPHHPPAHLQQQRHPLIVPGAPHPGVVNPNAQIVSSRAPPPFLHFEKSPKRVDMASTIQAGQEDEMQRMQKDYGGRKKKEPEPKEEKIIKVKQKRQRQRIAGSFRKIPVINAMASIIEDDDFDRTNLFPSGLMQSDDEYSSDEDILQVGPKFFAPGMDLPANERNSAVELYIQKLALKAEKAKLIRYAQVTGPLIHAAKTWPTACGAVLRSRDYLRKSNIPPAKLPKRRAACEVPDCKRRSVKRSSYCTEHLTSNTVGSPVAAKRRQPSATSAWKTSAPTVNGWKTDLPANFQFDPNNMRSHPAPTPKGGFILTQPGTLAPGMQSVNNPPGRYNHHLTMNQVAAATAFPRMSAAIEDGNSYDAIDGAGIVHHHQSNGFDTVVMNGQAMDGRQPTGPPVGPVTHQNQNIPGGDNGYPSEHDDSLATVAKELGINSQALQDIFAQPTTDGDEPMENLLDKDLFDIDQFADFEQYLLSSDPQTSPSMMQNNGLLSASDFLLNSNENTNAGSVFDTDDIDDLAYGYDAMLNGADGPGNGSDFDLYHHDMRWPSTGM